MRRWHWSCVQFCQHVRHRWLSPTLAESCLVNLFLQDLDMFGLILHHYPCNNAYFFIFVVGYLDPPKTTMIRWFQANELPALCFQRGLYSEIEGYRQFAIHQIDTCQNLARNLGTHSGQEAIFRPSVQGRCLQWKDLTRIAFVGEKTWAMTPVSYRLSCKFVAFLWTLWCGIIKHWFKFWGLEWQLATHKTSPPTINILGWQVCLDLGKPCPCNVCFNIAGFHVWDWKHTYVWSLENLAVIPGNP